MKGKPKYKLGDKVKFILSEGDIREGIIEIIDKWGTWDDPSDASYDIMISDFIHPSVSERGPGLCLCKHITEKKVLELISENNDSLL